MANAYAYRAKDQERLAEVDDPIGPDNDRWIDDLADRADIVVFACGTPKIRALQARAPAVSDRLVSRGIDLYALKVSASGAPWHPLYIADDTKPFLWCAGEKERKPWRK